MHVNPLVQQQSTTDDDSPLSVRRHIVVVRRRCCRRRFKFAYRRCRHTYINKYIYRVARAVSDQNLHGYAHILGLYLLSRETEEINRKEEGIDERSNHFEWTLIGI